MSSLLLRFLPHILVALGFSFIGAGLATSHAHSRYGALERRFSDYRSAQAEALAKAKSAADAEQERLLTQALEIEHAAREKSDLDATTIADLHKRYDRLRLAPRCPGPANLPEARDSGQHPSASPPGELLEADGRSFVDIAADAERVRGQLISCQSFLRSLQ